MREFLNEGGRALYTGKHAGTAHTSGNAQFYDPFENAACVGRRRPLPTGLRLGRRRERRARVLVRSGLVNQGLGSTRTGTRSTCSAWTTHSQAWSGASTAGQRREPGQRATRTSRRAASCLRTSTRSSRAGCPPGTTAPAGRSTRTRRLLRPLPDRGRVLQAPDEDGHAAAGKNLSFWTSYNTEPDWDFMFVEVHNVGQENWTTLPAPGRTTQSTGESCPEGWRELHPHLDHYQTLDETADVLSERQHAESRDLERRLRQLRGLGEVGRRPERLRGPANRGVDRLHQRLVLPGPGRVPRRRDDRRRDDRFRDDLGGWTVTGLRPGAPRMPTTTSASRARASPRGRRCHG